MKKTISILGSTGSIGLQTLEIIKKKKNFFDIFLLSANKNLSEIDNVYKKYKKKIIFIGKNKLLNFLKKKLKKIINI